MTIIKNFFTIILHKLKSLFVFFKRKPYILFFSVLYGCLLSKFYINQKINNLYKEQQLLKSYKIQIEKLNLEYNQIIYDYLRS
jgi:hypothetical protein